MMILELSRVTSRYGGITAIRDVSLEIRTGEMVALVGRNGAGKTTLLNTISGLVTRQAGTVAFQGKQIASLAPFRIARRGLLQVPEGRRILAPLSVMENLVIGAEAAGTRKGSIAADLERVFALFPVLADKRNQAGGALSGGQQQMLAIGRALMGRPALLFLDEPSLGLSPVVTSQVFEALATLNKGGLTILLVEQNARRALAAASRAYVIEQGRIVREGSSAELAADPKMIEAYLGEAAR